LVSELPSENVFGGFCVEKYLDSTGSPTATAAALVNPALPEPVSSCLYGLLAPTWLGALTIAFSLPFDGVPKGGHHAIERFWARRKQRSHC